MDFDPLPKNTGIIKFVPEIINRKRIFYEEINGEKLFSLGYFNEYTHSLVTCRARFDSNYNLLDCYIDVNLLDRAYEEFMESDSELSLEDLFDISAMLGENERVGMSYDGKTVSSFMSGENYNVDVHMGWVLTYALKEDNFRLMDITDKCIEYLCIKTSLSKQHRTTAPFRRIESICRVKNTCNDKVMKKVG